MCATSTHKNKDILKILYLEIEKNDKNEIFHNSINGSGP